MARGRHYAKLSLSNAARLSFSDLCSLLFMFLSLCRLCVCVFLCSQWSLVDVPLIFFCPADHVPDWQPRVLLGMVEARSVNVKKTTTTTRYRKDLQVSPGNGNVSIFALVPVPCLSGASLTPFPPEVAACSARVERFTLSSGSPLPEERSRSFRLIRSSSP